MVQESESVPSLPAILVFLPPHPPSESEGQDINIHFFHFRAVKSSLKAPTDSLMAPLWDRWWWWVVMGGEGVLSIHYFSVLL